MLHKMIQQIKNEAATHASWSVNVCACAFVQCTIACKIIHSFHLLFHVAFDYLLNELLSVEILVWIISYYFFYYYFFNIAICILSFTSISLHFIWFSFSFNFYANVVFNSFIATRQCFRFKCKRLKLLCNHHT